MAVMWKAGTNGLLKGCGDGAFHEGNFHRTEVFFGSGIRKDNEKIYFVTSCALTDRILYCADRNGFVFSNSLLLLLGFTGARLDRSHDYQNETVSVNIKGVNAYDREFKIVHPRIERFHQVFYENIVFEDGKIRFEFKPRKKLGIDCYETYYGLLLEASLKLKSNYDSNERNIPLQPFTTISAGYDSTAVSVLARKIGVEKCFSGNRLDGVLLKSRDEGGRKIAEKLGFTVLEMDTKRSSITEDELYFLSSNYPKFSKSVWSEISLHSMIKAIEDLNRSALVFTGYKGGTVWNVNLKEAYQEGVLKGSGAISGLNLAEIRLKAGFCTAPLPYLYIHHIKNIVAISKSEKMANWRLGTYYDRPIARRIVEDAGIERHLFGMEKRHITTTYLWPINKKNRQAFYRYLKKDRNIGKWFVLAYYLQKRVFYMMLGMKMRFGKDVDFYDLMRKWATDVLANRYSALLEKYRKTTS